MVGMLEMIMGSTAFPPRAMASLSRLISPAMALLGTQVGKERDRECEEQVTNAKTSGLV